MASVRKTFGLVVRQLREERHYTQEQLADLARISRNYLGNIERGEYNVTLEIVEQLAKGLDLSMSALLLAVEQRQG
jgi:transcriptional regulator with XRE-family HTH domain